MTGFNENIISSPMAFPDRYQITSTLGEGGMGIVYLAFDSVLKRQVAIKCIRPPRAEQWLSSEQSSQRLLREAQAAGSLQHPNIVAVYDIVPNGDYPAIVMEYLDGRALSHFIEPGQPWPSQHAISVLKQCASALDHAHSRNVVHRDIKPSNIMVDAAGVIRITDFGIAKQLSATTDLTQGAALGTLEYMSPEQLNGTVVDGRSDQYSLAVMAYQLLTGCKIFDAQTIGAWCAMVLGQAPLAPSKRFQGLPPEVDRVFSRALAKGPAERYSSCGEFASDLERVLTLRNVRNAHEVPTPTASAEPKPIAAPSATSVMSGIPLTALPAEHIRNTAEAWPHRSIKFVALAVTGCIALAAGSFLITHLMERKPRTEQAATSHPDNTKKEMPNRGTEWSPPAVVDFSASRYTVKSGESVELRWDVREAITISIDGVGNDLPIRGTQSIRPDASRTYLLKASGPGGAVEHPLTINVLREPMIHSFTASCPAIHSGEATLLQWNVSGATAVFLEGTGQLSRGQTDRPVCPTASKTYVLKATGPGGTAEKSAVVSVSIQAGQTVQLKEFRADPATIDRGQFSVLRWKVENASSVWIEPDIGQVEACGVRKVQPQSTTRYLLKYQNDRGTMSKPTVVTVE